jgi:hypothetical protein
LLEVPGARKLAGTGGSGVNIRIDMSCLLPILFSVIGLKVCMSGCCKFLLRYPIIYIRIYHCMLMVLFANSAAELKTAPLKERFGRGKKIPSKNHQRVLKHCKKN